MISTTATFRRVMRAANDASNSEGAHDLWAVEDEETIVNTSEKTIHEARQLHNKTALVTGATGALGMAIASVLCAQGATVVLSGRRADVLHRAATALNARSGRNACHVIPSDLAQPNDVAKLIEQATTTLGRLDVLVNNAGITRDDLMIRMKLDDFQSVLQVNLTAVFTLSRDALKVMMKQRSGRIINIASVVAVSGNVGQANYVAAKAGVIGLTKVVAQEGALRNITANVVAPGPIRSAMTAGLNDAVKASIIGRTPLGRPGSAWDVAHAVSFLASPAAGFITGHTLHVNGGMAMV